MGIITFSSKEYSFYTINVFSYYYFRTNRKYLNNKYHYLLYNTKLNEIVCTMETGGRH